MGTGLARNGNGNDKVHYSLDGIAVIFSLSYSLHFTISNGISALELLCFSETSVYFLYNIMHYTMASHVAIMLWNTVVVP